MQAYKINDIYKSLQGEGIREGTHNVFVRFTGCNMRCQMEAGPLSPGGFDCDTEFESGVKMSLDALIDGIESEDDLPDDTGFDYGRLCRWVILTGGEPGLQTDQALVSELHKCNYQIAIETNGSVELPDGIDWVTVSPKVAEHCIRQRTANEVKYVRGYGQELPKTAVVAEHYLISPTFNGLEPDARALGWCESLVEGTKWKLSVQKHKLWGIR